MKLTCLVLTPALIAAACMAQDCEPHWSDLFQHHGTNGPVTRAVTFDDGDGPALFISGSFGGAGAVGTGSLAKWDGRRWSAVGPSVWARAVLAVMDTGSGPRLHCLERLGSSSADPIAMTTWDGTTWSQISTLGSGVLIRDAIVFDDGAGLSLFVGGAFSEIGGVAAANIARWDGTQWHGVGGGTDWDVFCLEVHDDGSGPALYAAGAFTTAGGGPVTRVARWDGSEWTAIGSEWSWTVTGLASVPGAGSATLFACGEGFTGSGGPEAQVARWDGTAWIGLARSWSGNAVTLAAHDDGSGARLFAGGTMADIAGQFSRGVAVWDGASWAGLGRGVSGDGSVEFLSTGHFTDGDSLLVAGQFTGVGARANNIARWSTSGWRVFGGGFSGTAEGMVFFDEGSGPNLIAAGQIGTAGTVSVGFMGRWDGTDWSALPTPLTGTSVFHALLATDEFGAPRLFAGGAFLPDPPVDSPNLMVWDGSAWSAVGAGLNNTVYSLAAGPGSGSGTLYVGGRFSRAGSTPAERVAAWDGTSWSALGDGFNNDVLALAWFDDGGGPALYAGGPFSTSGLTPTRGIARWDGLAWTEPGGPFTGGDVHILKVLDDGSGPALYAGGTFQAINGVPAFKVARWNGAAWSALGPQFPIGLDGEVRDMVFADDGSGPDLYIALAESTQSVGLLKLEGGSWEVPWGGISGWVNSLALLRDLSTQQDLIFGGGGSFAFAGTVPSENIACLVGCPIPVTLCPADLNGDGLVDFSDYLEFLNLYDAQDLRADFNQDALVDFSDYLEFLNHYDAGC